MAAMDDINQHPLVHTWSYRLDNAVETVSTLKSRTSHPGAHRDALQFPSGQIVLVTRLRPGQMATVLQLPASEVNAKLVPVEEEHTVLRV